MWHSVPYEVLDIVLDKVDDDDVWACLTLSSCWAKCTRATQRLQLVDKAQLTTCKQLVAAMLRRKQQGIVQLGVKFAGVLNGVLACSVLLKELSRQVTLPRQAKLLS